MSVKRTVVMKFIILIAGILLLINTVIMAIVTNFNSGIIISFIVAIVLILVGVFFTNLYKIRWLRCCFYISVVLLLSLIAFIAVYGHSDNVTYTEDAVIVLGAGVNGDRVSLTLAYRLDKAVEYYNRNPDAVIVVSGGQGYQETITEALAMERYLINMGIPEDKIIKEELSTSTYTNFYNSKEILDKYFSGPYKAALITNDFHIYRATIVAQTVGIDCTHYHAKIQWYTIPVNYLRECVAVLKTWFISA